MHDCDQKIIKTKSYQDLISENTRINEIQQKTCEMQQNSNFLSKSAKNCLIYKGRYSHKVRLRVSHAYPATVFHLTPILNFSMFPRIKRILSKACVIHILWQRQSLDSTACGTGMTGSTSQKPVLSWLSHIFQLINGICSHSGWE